MDGDKDFIKGFLDSFKNDLRFEGLSEVYVSTLPTPDRYKIDLVAYRTIMSIEVPKRYFFERPADVKEELLREYKKRRKKEELDPPALSYEEAKMPYPKIEPRH